MRRRKRTTYRDRYHRRADPGSSTFRIADYPFYLIARVGGLYAACLDRGLKPRGMDQPRWRVLMILSEHNPAAMGLISEMAVMKLPTVVKLVQRMVKEGLVRTAPRATDQRVSEVKITAAGRRALVVVKQTASDVFSRAAENLGGAQLERLNAVLHKIEINLEQSRRAPRSA